MKEIKNTGIGLFLMLLFLGNPSLVLPNKIHPRTSISFSAGFYQPVEKSFKELYGSYKFQVNFSLQYRLSIGAALFSGVRYLACTGNTTITGPEFQDEKYRLKFTMYSIPFGLTYSFSFKNISPFIGGGISYNIYREEWNQMGISFEGKKFGVFLTGGIEYFIGKRFSLLGSSRYSYIPTQKGSKLDEKVNLGAVEFFLGFSFHF